MFDTDNKALKYSLIALGVAVLFGIGILVGRLWNQNSGAPDLSGVLPNFTSTGESAGLQAPEGEEIPEAPLAPSTAIPPVSNGGVDSARLEADAAAAAAGCNVQVSHGIAVDSFGQNGQAQMVASGPSCDSAQFTLNIKDSSGQVVFTQNISASALSIPANAQIGDIRARLDAVMPDSAAHGNAYPAWNDGAGAPDGILVGRSDYQSIRAADRPIICLKTDRVCLVSNGAGSDLAPFSRN